MSKHRLLVIEDDENIADLVCRAAEEVGFEVRSTCKFTEIASLYDAFAPHVIVLDILMPDMDGFEVLKFLHTSNSTSRVVILSGRAGRLPPNGIQHGGGAGAYNCCNRCQAFPRGRTSPDSEGDQVLSTFA